LQNIEFKAVQMRGCFGNDKLHICRRSSKNPVTRA
jgi:hypothetical protein